jgi:hypothetical protein
MQGKRQITLCIVLLAMFLMCATMSFGQTVSAGSGEATLKPASGLTSPISSLQAFAGQDIHLSGKNLVSSQISTGGYGLLFTENFSMSLGGAAFKSDNAVVLLETRVSEFRGRTYIYYEGKAYLTGNVSSKRGKNALTAKLTEEQAENGAMVLRFEVTGDCLITADTRETGDVRDSELYKKAKSVMVSQEPGFVIHKQAIVPGVSPMGMQAGETKEKNKAKEFVERAIAREKKGQAESAAGGLRFMYPVNIAPAGESSGGLKIESVSTTEGINAATVIGKFFIWQKQDETGRLLELSAERAVIFYAGQQQQINDEPNNPPQERPASPDDALSKGEIKAVYVAGDVQMTDGSRTIRAEEIYYDFETKSSVILNASMRSFDESRNIPIYVRAAKLREIAESKFVAEDVTITSSEFYEPQIKATAAAAIITDTTNVDSQEEKGNKNSYQAEMKDVKFKLDGRTFFAWPMVQTNLERPDTPIKSVRFSHDNRWGAAIETEWYFAQLLGLQEPEGVDGTMMVDYFGKRGPGGGFEINYTKETYYGRILGYIIQDHGKDYLGRDDSRESIEPGKDTRGRFSIRHRQFLTDKWQLTTEYNYSSDQYFMESFYRNEFNVYMPETYIHLKQIKDNRGLSILSKWRTNDFEDTLQESPTVEYHRVADSLLDDKFSLYTDIQLSRLRQKIGELHTTSIDENPFTFISYRAELDMPLRIDTFKVVPYIAGTFGYDDRSGFERSLVDGSNTGPVGEEQVWIGEAGVRIFPQAWWKVYPDVKSRLWDIDQIRHVIQPSITATMFKESDSVVDQPDILSLGLSQRLQTKRGPADKKETVDWMRIDTEYVMVENDSDATDAGPGPDRFLWAKPIVPLRVYSAPQLFNGDMATDLHRFEMYGPKRDYLSTDYFWRLSDTTALLSDVYYDMKSGDVQQFDVGFSRLAWPNLTYYVGNRYLKRTDILDKKGSSAFTFAATYILDPRYTVVFAQQYDFKYGSNIRSDVTLIRNYHRVSCGFTISIDDSLARRAVMFSIWPQGVKEMAFGDKRYMDIGGSSGF